VSDIGAEGSDVMQKEASGISSDSQHVSASVVNENEVDQTAGNKDKESVTMKEMEEEASSKDLKRSKVSSVKHEGEVKNGGTGQRES